MDTPATRRPGENEQGTKAQEPPDKEGADKATQDNDLTSGHTRDGDGGDDNAKS